MSREPKIHIGKWTPNKRPTLDRILISLGHRFSKRQQVHLKTRRTGIAMSDITNAHALPAALTGSMRDFRVPGGQTSSDALKAFSSGKICVVRTVSGRFLA
jgi:hypothetical protein